MDYFSLKVATVLNRTFQTEMFAEQIRLGKLKVFVEKNRLGRLLRGFCLPNQTPQANFLDSEWDIFPEKVTNFVQYNISVGLFRRKISI